MAKSKLPVKSIKALLKQAKENTMLRGAFGFVVRQNYNKLRYLGGPSKKQFIKDIGLADSYYTELNKELSVCDYTEMMVVR